MRNLTKQETELQKAIDNAYQYAVYSNFEMGNTCLLATAYELQTALVKDKSQEKDQLLTLLRHELRTDDYAYDCYNELMTTVIILDYFELYKNTKVEECQKLLENKYLKQLVKRLSYSTLEEFVNGYGYTVSEHLMPLITEEYDYQSLKYFGIVNDYDVDVTVTIETEAKNIMVDDNDLPFGAGFEVQLEQAYIYEVHQMEKRWNHEAEQYELKAHKLIDTFDNFDQAHAFVKGANKAFKMHEVAGEELMRFACIQQAVN